MGVAVVFVRRIILADEQVMFRIGVAREIDRVSQLRLVGKGGSAHDAIRLIRENRPHLALFSDTLPGITGGALAQELQRFWPTLAMGIIVQTRIADPGDGVWIIPRTATPDQLVRTLREMTRFQRLLGSESPGSPTTTMVPDHRHGLLAIGQSLSSKEIEVLDCVAHGYSNKEIGNALSLTEQTVKNHLTSVFRKLGVDDRVQAVLRAAQLGWVDLAPPSSGAENQRLTS